VVRSTRSAIHAAAEQVPDHPELTGASKHWQDGHGRARVVDLTQASPVLAVQGSDAACCSTTSIRTRAVSSKTECSGPTRG
jgi:hypothetical protein